MYVRPTVESPAGDPEARREPIRLAVSGRLWRDALIMFDRETGSLWSQILGEAVAGPLEGKRLAELPSQVTTWKDWRTRHPDTLVLEKPRQRGSVYDDYFHDERRIGVVGSRNPDPRLPVKTLVFGLEPNGKAVAVPFARLEEHPALNLDVAGTALVLFSPPGEQTALAYLRRVGDRELTFHAAGPASGQGRARESNWTVRDEQTGSTWAWEEGECTEGELAGSRLTPVEGVAVYWGVWARYHRDSLLVD